MYIILMVKSLLETELLNYDFIRISRNALINLHYVKSVTKDLIVMKNGHRFYISSRKLKDIKNAINAFNEDKKC